MNHQAAGRWGRISTSVLTLVIAAWLAPGCGKGDTSEVAQDGTKIDQSPGTGDKKSAVPGQQAGSQGHSKNKKSGKADWDTVGKLTVQALDLGGPLTAVDPSGISKDGLHKPIEAMGFKETGFRVAYSKSKNPLHDQFRIAFQKEGVFEAIATELNASLRMTKTIDIQLVDCGQVNAFYDPNNGRVIVCYEIMGYFMNMFRPVSKTSEELGTSVVGATFFAFFHELGHALRHTLKLPVTGKEEDAVDQLATLILIQGGDTGVNAALAGARWFALQHEENKKKGAPQMPFWDEHSLSAQRFYNIACLIYGSAPDKYENLVKNKYLPRERAMKCEDEFKNIKGAWEMILAKHTRNGATMAGAGLSQPKVAAASKPVTVPATPVPSAAREKVKTQPRAKPVKSDIRCEAVAQKVVQLFVVYAAKDANPKTPAERQLVQQQISGRVPALMQSAVDTCNSKPWTHAQRQCVLKAASLKAADKCDKAR